MYKIITIKKNTILYHGTKNEFDMNNIKTPCWFSTIKEQSINHLCYRHYSENGLILTYKLKNDIRLIDISNDGDIRIFINANGNYKLAEKIKNKEFGNINGYCNFPEQAEIMLTSKKNLEPIKKEYIKLNHKVKYKRINKNNWRMKEDRQCCTIL